MSRYFLKGYMSKQAENNSGLGLKDIINTFIKHEDVNKGATPGFKFDKDHPWPHDTLHGKKVHFPNPIDNTPRTGLAYFHPDIPEDKYKQYSREMLKDQFRSYREDNPDINLINTIKKFDHSESGKTKLKMLLDNNPYINRKNLKNIPLHYFLKGDKIRNPGR